MALEGATSPVTKKAVRPEIDREEILRRLEDPSLTLVNVLPSVAFDEGRIPGSLNLPVGDIEHRAGEVLPDRSREIAVYCAGPT